MLNWKDRLIIAICAGILTLGGMQIAKSTTSYNILNFSSTEYPANSGAATITSGGTYQVLATSGNRNGCSYQNNGSSTQWIFLGPIISATHATSFKEAPGATFNCAMITNSVINDAISIDGTTNDTFVFYLQ